MSTTPETDPTGRALPPDSQFGVATAAYQIEGGASLGGRTPSTWDVFSGVPGRIADGAAPPSWRSCRQARPERSPSITCTAGRRTWRCCRSFGVDAYRFSLSWPRVQPHGSGPESPDGMGFYDRLVDGLLAAGIRPCVSLYHRDRPLELMEHGGSLIRETADRRPLRGLRGTGCVGIGRPGGGMGGAGVAIGDGRSGGHRQSPHDRRPGLRQPG